MKLQKSLLALFFAEQDSIAKAAGRESRKGWTLQLRGPALVVMGLFKRPCWPLYHQGLGWRLAETALSPKRLLLVAIGTGVFGAPSVSRCYKNAILEIKLYFRSWRLLQGWVYPRRPPRGYVSPRHIRTGDERWSGKSWSQMRGVAKQGLGEEEAQACVPGLRPQPHAQPWPPAPQHRECGVSTTPMEEELPPPCPAAGRPCARPTAGAAGRWQPGCVPVKSHSSACSCPPSTGRGHRLLSHEDLWLCH